ncbi:hypothetical protein LINPERPRIM_LOCUS1624 [Linum perenne]
MINWVRVRSQYRRVVALKKSLSRATKHNKLRPNLLDLREKILIDINRIRWHTCVDKLGEERVDLFGRFEAFEARDLVIELTHFGHQHVLLLHTNAAHVFFRRWGMQESLS